MRKGYLVIEATNWYSYTNNNPVRYADPTGLSEVEDARGRVTHPPLTLEPPEPEPSKPDGYNVYSISDGIYKGGQWNYSDNHDKGLGYYVVVEDEDGKHKYNYGHLNEDSVKNNGLEKDDEVKEGDYLGRIEEDDEEAGNSSGPHVHLERRERDEDGKKWGKRVDPGEESPLIDNSVNTAKFENYPDGSPHDGIDFAPEVKKEPLE